MIIIKSPLKNKKYRAIIGDNKIDFGDNRFQHYKDSTPLKLWTHLDHNNKERRRKYFLRHSGVDDKKNAIKKEFIKSGNKITAKILSHFYLW